MEFGANMLQQIILDLPNYIFWKDRDLIYRGCNYNFAKVAGFSSPADVIGKTDNDMPWKETTAHIYQAEDRQILETGRAILDKEIPMIIETSEERILSVSKVPLYSGKNIVGILGIYTDITDRKKMEESLIKEKEAAKAADRAKTEFLENMRHDIRTPLTGIIGFANLIHEEAKGKKIKKYANIIEISGNALLHLLNEVLDLIKVASGGLPISKKKFHLKDKITDVINLNQAKAAYKNIKLLIEYDNNIPNYVIGDSKRIHRVILELVNNAINFTQIGFVKVSSILAKQLEKDLVIKIIVEDTGLGISEDTQIDIFDQFKRLTPSYKEIYKGHGIGLSIVKQFIDDLGGEIYVESLVNKGTKFICVIPLKVSLLDDNVGAEIIENKIVTSPRTTIINNKKNNIVIGAKYNVLLVEDNKLSAIVAEKILSGLNCKVNIAENGKTAIDLYNKGVYDIIFMDVGLPDLDGYEVTNKIRLLELTKNLSTPIVALTAHIDDEHKQKCIESGMNAVLTKPLLVEKAINVLDTFIPIRWKTNPKIKITNKVEKLLPLKNKVIDIEAGLKLYSGDRKCLLEMLTMLVNGFQKNIQEFETAFQDGNWILLKNLVHKMKGGATYCATTRLKNACIQLENCLTESNEKKTKKSFNQVLKEIENIGNYVDDINKKKQFDIFS